MEAKIGAKVALVLVLGIFVLFGWAREAPADVNIHINPPAFFFPASPAVVVIPGTYVYAVPDVGIDIFFYDGYWYRPYEGYWFYAEAYNGPWFYIPPPRIPRVLLALPPYYREVPPGHRHIPYGQLKKNWARWQREKYWERNPEWRAGWAGHEGRGRGDWRRDRRGFEGREERRGGFAGEERPGRGFEKKGEGRGGRFEGRGKGHDGGFAGRGEGKGKGHEGHGKKG